MDMIVDTPEILLRLALAVIFGGVLGFERERRRRPAGLRTHMMVALGSTTFTLLAFEFYAHAAEVDSGVTRVDPLRILEGIIGGLGFLCAGTIIQNRGGVVEGLTTASSLWCVGAVGVATGGGHYLIAAATVAVGLVILGGLLVIERRLGADER